MTKAELIERFEKVRELAVAAEDALDRGLLQMGHMHPMPPEIADGMRLIGEIETIAESAG